jgi:hypothetical protein
MTSQSILTKAKQHLTRVKEPTKAQESSNNNYGIGGQQERAVGCQKIEATSKQLGLNADSPQKIRIVGGRGKECGTDSFSQEYLNTMI